MQCWGRSVDRRDTLMSSGLATKCTRQEGWAEARRFLVTLGPVDTAAKSSQPMMPPLSDAFCQTPSANTCSCCKHSHNVVFDSIAWHTNELCISAREIGQSNSAAGSNEHCCCKTKTGSSFCGQPKHRCSYPKLHCCVLCCAGCHRCSFERCRPNSNSALCTCLARRGVYRSVPFVSLPAQGVCVCAPPQRRSRC